MVLVSEAVKTKSWHIGANINILIKNILTCIIFSKKSCLWIVFTIDGIWNTKSRNHSKMEKAFPFLNRRIPYIIRSIDHKLVIDGLLFHFLIHSLSPNLERLYNHYFLMTMSKNPISLQIAKAKRLNLDCIIIL